MGLDDTRHLMPHWLAPLVCLLLIIPVALVVAINLVVGLNYHPDKKASYATVGLAFTALVLVIFILVLVRWRRGALVGGTKYLAWSIGGSLGAAGTYLLIVDSGDVVLWIWFLLLGLAMIWMATGRHAP